MTQKHKLQLPKSTTQSSELPPQTTLQQHLQAIHTIQISHTISIASEGTCKRNAGNEQSLANIGRHDEHEVGLRTQH